MVRDTRPVYLVAKTLSTRGQTIHGREKIVELCSKSGVLLLDGVDEEMQEQDSEQGLMNFIIGYSQLSPASRLAVMVLARQHGLALPAHLMQRKNALKTLLDNLSQYFPRI
ncbi:MAG: hypothetical protein QXS20_02275 [Candidatus Thorarchaeota archaeon]